MKARGFAIPSLTSALIGLALVAAVTALIWGAIAWHADTHFERGQQAKQVEWDKKKAEDAADGALRDAEVRAVLLSEQKRADDAEAAAATSKRLWEEERREANRKSVALASCTMERAAAAVGAVQPAGESPPVAGSGLRAPVTAGGGAGGGGGRILLHWRFVWLHDGAFTGLDGQPLFRDPARAGPDDPRADTPSPYGLDDALDVAAANADALSTCRRAYLGAIVKLERAAAAWDQANEARQ